MKKTKTLTILTLLLFNLISCKNSDNSDFKAKIINLEKKNAELQDSILKIQTDNLLHFQLLGISEQSTIAIGEKGKVNFVFAPRKEIGKYKVYRLIDDNKRELILDNQSFSEFTYYFTPKNKEDNMIKLLAVFEKDSFEVEIPAFSPIIVTD